jgi:hypothetical protein
MTALKDVKRGEAVTKENFSADHTTIFFKLGKFHVNKLEAYSVTPFYISHVMIAHSYEFHSIVTQYDEWIGYSTWQQVETAKQGEEVSKGNRHFHKKNVMTKIDSFLNKTNIKLGYKEDSQ